MSTDLDALRLKALSGDAAALNALCLALSDQVFRLCLRMLGNTRDAEDATQDVLVKVVTHLGQFEGRSALTTWVHQIAVRQVLSMQKSRAELLSLDEDRFSQLLDQGLAFGANQPPATPEERALVDEVRLSCTQGMLLILSREERLAIVLVELLGFDCAEAAEIAEVSHDAFRQRLARSRARLGGFLESKCGLRNEAAACRCHRQLRAKQSLGLKPRLSSLCGHEKPHLSAEVGLAAAELRHLHSIASAFHTDGLFVAPETLRQRLRTLVPSAL